MAVSTLPQLVAPSSSVPAPAANPRRPTASQSSRQRFNAELSQCLVDFVIQLLPTVEELAVKEDVRKLLERLIRTIEPDSRLLSFGSTANGFSLRNSDMDLCCLIDSDERLSASDLVTMLGDLLERETKFHVKPLPHARIPIVKLSLDPSPGLPLGIACDIGFENRLALENTRLLYCYAMIDPTRVRTLVLFLKVWCKRRKINSPYRGTLSSYGYVLLVIYFLVHVKNPPVLPNLQQMPPMRPIAPAETHINGHNVWFFDDIELLRQRWQSANRESVGQLLTDFFKYYSRDFLYNSGVASIRAGLLKKETKGWQNDLDSSRYKDSRERNRFCIEDPFETDFNVARCVTRDGLYLIRGEFMRASRILALRPDRALGAIAELCEERDESLPPGASASSASSSIPSSATSSHTTAPVAPPRLSHFPPQTPYTVGSSPMRPTEIPMPAPVASPASVEPPAAVPAADHMLPQRHKWTSPPPPDAPPAERASFESALGASLSLATAREPELTDDESDTDDARSFASVASETSEVPSLMSEARFERAASLAAGRPTSPSAESLPSFSPYIPQQERGRKAPEGDVVQARGRMDSPRRSLSGPPRSSKPQQQQQSQSQPQSQQQQQVTAAFAQTQVLYETRARGARVAIPFAQYAHSPVVSPLAPQTHSPAVSQPHSPVIPPTYPFTFPPYVSRSDCDTPRSPRTYSPVAPTYVPAYAAVQGQGQSYSALSQYAMAQSQATVQYQSYSPKMQSQSTHRGHGSPSVRQASSSASTSTSSTPSHNSPSTRHSPSVQSSSSSSQHYRRSPPSHQSPSQPHPPRAYSPATPAARTHDLPPVLHGSLGLRRRTKPPEQEGLTTPTGAGSMNGAGPSSPRDIVPRTPPPQPPSQSPASPSAKTPTAHASFEDQTQTQARQTPQQYRHAHTQSAVYAGAEGAMDTPRSERRRMSFDRTEGHRDVEGRISVSEEDSGSGGTRRPSDTFLTSASSASPGSTSAGSGSPAPSSISSVFDVSAPSSPTLAGDEKAAAVLGNDAETLGKKVEVKEVVDVWSSSPSGERSGEKAAGEVIPGEDGEGTISPVQDEQATPTTVGDRPPSPGERDDSSKENTSGTGADLTTFVAISSEGGLEVEPVSEQPGSLTGSWIDVETSDLPTSSTSHNVNGETR